MNRIEFGQLVTALRKEQRDENYNVWTQKTLGEKTGLGELVVGKIERGQRAILDENVLLCLANALQLTSLERKEFFFSALDIDSDQIAFKGSDSETILNNLIEKMAEIQLPAYITDPFGDVVAANALIIGLLEISSDYIDSGYILPAGFNHMRVGFSPESGFSKLLGPQWHSAAIQIMQLFRGCSLRYRSSPYFAHTFSALRKYPLFGQYWR